MFNKYVKNLKKIQKAKKSTKLLKELEKLMQTNIPTTEQQVKMIDLKTQFEEDLENLRTEMIKKQIEIIRGGGENAQ
tara:strand:- start:210 stop:440 length:231 start_codon:yes stop_codon:yes gene_type:complete